MRMEMVVGPLAWNMQISIFIKLYFASEGQRMKMQFILHSTDHNIFPTGIEIDGNLM